MTVLGALALSAVAASGPEIHGIVMPRSEVGPVDAVPLDTTGMGVSVREWGVSTPTPPLKLVEDRWQLANLVAFEHTFLAFDNPPSFVAADHANLFRIQWALVSLWTPSDRATLVVLAQPGLYSDFGGALAGRDFGFVGMLLGAWRFGEGFSAGLGGGYVQLFGRPTLTPFLALDAEKGRLSVHVLAPREAEVWVRLADPARLGAIGTMDGGFYLTHPDHPTYTDIFQEYSVLIAGPAAELTVREKLALTLTGGWALRRQMELYVDPDTLLVDFSAEPGLAFELQLALVLDKQ